MKHLHQVLVLLMYKIMYTFLFIKELGYTKLGNLGYNRRRNISKALFNIY